MFRTNAKLVRAVVIVMPWTLCFTVVSSADDAVDVRMVVERLFEVGWDTSFASRATTDREFNGLSPIVQSEPRIRYARALTLIKQGRQREAKDGVDTLVKTYGESITPLKTKIWLAVLTEQYGQAMADIETLSGLLSKQPDGATKGDEYRTTARTLGLLFGYLEGPRADKVSTTTLANHQKKVQDRLDAKLQDAFREGQRDAIVLYLDLKQQYEEKENEAKRESERVRVQESKRIAAERERLVEQHKRLKEEIAQRREELQSELDTMASAESPLVQQQAVADRHRVAAFRELTEVVDDIDFLERRLARERDPIIRAHLRREIRRLDIIADDIRIDVLEAERQIALAQNEIDGLRRRSAQLQANMGGELKRAEGEYRNIEQRQKKLVADEKKLEKPILDSRPLLPLRRKIDSLATYTPFPLEEEKRRLLDSL